MNDDNSKISDNFDASSPDDSSDLPNWIKEINFNSEEAMAYTPKMPAPQDEADIPTKPIRVKPTITEPEIEAETAVIESTEIPIDQKENAWVLESDTQNLQPIEDVTPDFNDTTPITLMIDAVPNETENPLALHSHEETIITGVGEDADVEENFLDNQSLLTYQVDSEVLEQTPGIQTDNELPKWLKSLIITNGTQQSNAGFGTADQPTTHKDALNLSDNMDIDLGPQGNNSKTESPEVLLSEDFSGKPDLNQPGDSLNEPLLAASENNETNFPTSNESDLLNKIQTETAKGTNPKELITLLENWLIINPESRKGWEVLGDLLMHSGHSSKAFDAYTKASQLSH